MNQISLGLRVISKKKRRYAPVNSRCLQIAASPIGAIAALMNRVRQQRPLVVLGLNVWMGTAARTSLDQLVESGVPHPVGA